MWSTEKVQKIQISGLVSKRRTVGVYPRGPVSKKRKEKEIASNLYTHLRFRSAAPAMAAASAAPPPPPAVSPAAPTHPRLLFSCPLPLAASPPGTPRGLSVVVRWRGRRRHRHGASGGGRRLPRRARCRSATSSPPSATRTPSRTAASPCGRSPGGRRRRVRRARPPPRVVLRRERQVGTRAAVRAAPRVRHPPLPLRAPRPRPARRRARGVLPPRRHGRRG